MSAVPQDVYLGLFSYAQNWFWQQPSAKQLDTSASIHLPLQGFETVDFFLDRPIAPRFCNRPFHRV